MKTVKLLGIAVLLASSAHFAPVLAVAQTKNLAVLDSRNGDYGLTHAQYNAVLDEIEKVYRPILAARGITFKIKRRWNDSDSTDEVDVLSQGGKDRRLTIVMSGHAARHRGMTQDSLALQACRQLGDRLSGAPKEKYNFSVAGQAAYFATLKCMRQILADSDTASFTRLPSTEQADLACHSVYSQDRERQICGRSLMAALILEENEYVNDGWSSMIPYRPRLDTPDGTIQTEIFKAYPNPQCLLDTYVQGALCAKPVSEELDGNDSSKGACTRSGGYRFGMRPRCWYKPPVGEDGILKGYHSNSGVQTGISAAGQLTGIIQNALDGK